MQQEEHSHIQINTKIYLTIEFLQLIVIQRWQFAVAVARFLVCRSPVAIEQSQPEDCLTFIQAKRTELFLLNLLQRTR